MENKWYSEPRFVDSIIAILTLSFAISVGTSIVDKQINLIGLYGVVFAAFVILVKYLLRNNK